jgi:hypothetical protein
VLGDCVQVRAGAPTRTRSACGFTQVADTIVAVPCAVRRTVVVMRLGRAARGLTVTTSDGSVRGRHHGGVAIAVLPPRAALREIRLIGAARLRVRLPAAARQCGYTAYVPTPRR